MSLDIKYIKDTEGNNFFPLVHEKGVVDDNGITLESKLQSKQDAISDIEAIRSGANLGTSSIQSVTVGTTTTGLAGSSASVTNTGTATEPVLSFTIPQGAQGIQGIQGPQGERGPQGNTGVQVDSVASIIHSIDPTATYAAADVAGADAVQDVLSEVTELEGRLQIETSIKNDYVSTIHGYCKGATIMAGDKHNLYLYQLAGGKKYKFTKVGSPENATRLVFSIAGTEDFVVGGSVQDAILLGSASNGDFYYTPDSDTYVVVELDRISPVTVYISDVTEIDVKTIQEYEPLSDYDDYPTENSNHTVKSGGVYHTLQGISYTIEQRTFVNQTYQFADIEFVHNKYYNTHGKGIGSAAPALTNTSADSYCVKLAARKGVKYTVASRSGGSSDYDRSVTFTENDVIVYITDYHDAITTPATYTMQADGYIYINLLGTYTVSFYITESSPVSDADDVPTANSGRLVKSGGVFSSLQNLSDSLIQRTQLTTTHTQDDMPITTGFFYYTHGKSVGSPAPTLNATTDQVYVVKIPVKAGTTCTVSARSLASSDYARPVVFCENDIIVAMTTYNDAVGTPFTYTMQTDGDLYINLNAAYLDELSVVESAPLSAVVSNLTVKKTYPMVLMPKKLYGVVGETQQLFYRGIVRKWNPYQYFLRINASGFKSTPRYTQVTPSAVGTTDIICNIVDDDYDISPNVLSTLIVKSAPSSSGAINVLCLGASTVINPNCFPVELERRLCQTGGTPSGLGLTNISFVGRKTVKSSSVHCEATGGWTWYRFVTQGTQTIRFYLANADTGYINAIYSFASSSGTVQVRLIEWNVTAGAGDALFEYVNSSDAGKYPTSQSGTLAYVSGGENTPPNLSFTDYSVEAANPFWNTSTNLLDIKMYADAYCNGSIDVLITELDTFNSMVVGDSSVDTILGYMKEFIDAYHSDFPNGKVIIASSCPPNAYYGIEYNYGGTSVANSWSVLFNRFIWAKACDDLCNDDDYSSFCYYANTFGEIDTEYAFPTEQRDVDTRIDSITEAIGTNGVHPTATGNKMEADAIYRCFVCNILNE